MDGKTPRSTGPSSRSQPQMKSQFYSDQVLTAAQRSFVMRAQTRNSKWFLCCVKSSTWVVAAYHPVLRRILKLYSIQPSENIHALKVTDDRQFGNEEWQHTSTLPVPRITLCLASSWSPVQTQLRNHFTRETQPASGPVQRASPQCFCALFFPTLRSPTLFSNCLELYPSVSL